MKRAWVFSLVVMLAPARALADPTPAEAELATARALFEEGLAREDARDWTGALARFRRVSEIRVTPQVVYNIALCLDRLGKLASADKEYARVERDAASSSEATVRELARLATARRRELRGAIPELVLSGPNDLVVTLDAEPATLATPIAIDAGAHEIVVRRGSAEARRRIDVAAGSKRTTIALPIPEEPAAQASPSIPPAAFITGGVSLAAFGVAIASALVRSSAIDELDAACGPARDRCPEDKRPTLDRVHTTTAIANVGVGVGIAGAVATGVLVYFAFKSKSDATALLAPLSF